MVLEISITYQRFWLGKINMHLYYVGNQSDTADMLTKQNLFPCFDVSVEIRSFESSCFLILRTRRLYLGCE